MRTGTSLIVIYNLEHTNIRYRPDPNDLTRWAVRGKERSRGVELNVMGHVHPQWFVRGSLGLMSAKIVENRQNRAEEGRYLTNTARINGNLFVRYAPRPWFAEAGLTHIGKRYYQLRSEELVYGCHPRRIGGPAVRLPGRAAEGRGDPGQAGERFGEDHGPSKQETLVLEC